MIVRSNSSTSGTADLEDLVNQPRETLAIEIKGHLDLNENSHRANLARHICALSNYGGGYIVFGFDDDLQKASLPADIASHYHRDIISSVVATYLSPALLCDVTYVSSAMGRIHPIIRVPAHAAVPISAKKNGPHDSNGKPQGLVSGQIYIRVVGANGPESVQISRPEDWEKLIRRCVLADRTALLGLIESLLSPVHTPAAKDRLEQWHDAGRSRFLSLLEKHQPEWKTPLDRNYYELSYSIQLGTGERIRAADLIPILQSANSQTRELVWTGWSMIYPFSREEIAPYFITDAASGQSHHEILETSLLGETVLDTMLPDFWRVSLDGKVSLIRAYREDRTAYPQFDLQPGHWFSPFFLAREIAEIVRHARAMSESFQTAWAVAFRCEWSGLEGRRIADPEADGSKVRIAKTDHRICTGEWPVSDLVSNWPGIVSELSSCVTRLFDPELGLSEEWVRRIAPKFRSL